MKLSRVGYMHGSEGYWRKSDCTLIAIPDMENRHLINSLDLMFRIMEEQRERGIEYDKATGNKFRELSDEAISRGLEPG